MKKFGGILLILIGLVLIIFSALRGAATFIVIFNGEITAYGMGALTGTVVVVVLFVAIGLKCIKKGRSLLANEA